MYIWELRRRYRQAVRNWRPPTKVNLQQASRRHVIITFVLFFIGWKLFGITLNKHLFYRFDETTGQMRMFSPGEVRQEMIKRAEEAQRLQDSASASLTQSGFSLDA